MEQAPRGGGGWRVPQFHSSSLPMKTRNTEPQFQGLPPSPIPLFKGRGIMHPFDPSSPKPLHSSSHSRRAPGEDKRPRHPISIFRAIPSVGSFQRCIIPPWSKHAFWHCTRRIKHECKKTMRALASCTAPASPGISDNGLTPFHGICKPPEVCKSGRIQLPAGAWSNKSGAGIRLLVATWGGTEMGTSATFVQPRGCAQRS